MKDTVQFIYFDVGSTLVNEEAVFLERLRLFANEEKLKNRGISYNQLKEEFFILQKEVCNPIRVLKNRYDLFMKIPYPVSNEKLYDETKNVLDYLSKKYRLGILANQMVGLKQRLEDWGILSYFEVVFSSEDYDFKKPDDAFFEIAIKYTKLNPSSIAMVGDRLDNDILPAVRLGMQAIWVNHYSRTTDAKCIQIYKLKEIIDIL